MRRPFRTFLLAVAVALGGCAEGESGATSEPTPLPTASPVTPAPSPTDDGPDTGEVEFDTCTPPDLCRGEVTPGEYVVDSVGSTLRFTLGDGWLSSEEIPEVGIELVRPEEGDANALSMVTFGGDVFVDICGESDATTTIGTSPSEFITWLSERDGIDAGQPLEVEVGGRPAVQVDLTTQLPDNCTHDSEWLWLWVLPVVGDFHFADAERARVIAVDAPGGTVVLIAEAYPGVDDDSFLATAMDVVESLEIEE